MAALADQFAALLGAARGGMSTGRFELSPRITLAGLTSEVTVKLVLAGERLLTANAMLADHDAVEFYADRDDLFLVSNYPWRRSADGFLMRTAFVADVRDRLRGSSSFDVGAEELRGDVLTQLVAWLDEHCPPR